MITLFAIPKPFVGHTAVIQNNAIQSWKTFHPDYQIVLFGDEEGIAAAAREHGVDHIPKVKRNDLGTPLMNAVFDEAEGIARFPILCYVNSDIMLLTDLSAAVERVRTAGNFLMVGQRWDLDVTERLDLSRPGSEQALRSRTMTQGGLALLWAMDYFIYPRGMWKALPEFAIGRPGWDNWMLYEARRMDILLINATLAVMAVHQNHPPAYSIDGVEAVQNRATLYASGMERDYTLLDASAILTLFDLQRCALRAPEQSASDLELMPRIRSIFTDVYAGRTLSIDERFYFDHVLASTHWYEANLDIRQKNFAAAIRNIRSAQRYISHGYSWKRFFTRAVKEIKRFISSTLG